jgi:hypothetical protein
VIRLVQSAPIARGITAEAGKIPQRRCILPILGKAPPPPKPMVRGRGNAKRKQHIEYNGRLSDCADEFMRMVEQEAGFNSMYEDLAQMEETDLALNAIGGGGDHEAAELSEVDEGMAGAPHLRMEQTLSWTCLTGSEETGVQRSLSRHCRAP